MLVTELHRLLARHKGSSCVRGASESCQEPENCTDDKYRTEQEYLENRIGTGVKCLWHAIVSFLNLDGRPSKRTRMPLTFNLSADHQMFELPA